MTKDQHVPPPAPPRGARGAASWSLVLGLWSLPLLAGCAQAPAAKPAPAAVNGLDFERFVATQLPFDPLLVKQGDYALYALKIPGQIRPEHYRWSAVSADPKGLWVEIRVPHAETGMISKTRYDRAGKVVEVWMGPPGGVPAQVWPKPGSSMTPPPRPAAAPPLREEPDTLSVATRVFRCVKVTADAVDPQGRKVPVVSWFSPDVPFPGQARYGGLVKRQVGRVTLELFDAGNRKSIPELDIPK
jgi:hypothetical protein